MICPNCKTKHGCGCQAKKASNGASVCTTCIVSYEASLKNQAQDPNSIRVSVTFPNQK